MPPSSGNLGARHLGSCASRARGAGAGLSFCRAHPCRPGRPAADAKPNQPPLCHPRLAAATASEGSGKPHGRPRIRLVTRRKALNFTRGPACYGTKGQSRLFRGAPFSVRLPTPGAGPVREPGAAPIRCRWPQRLPGFPRGALAVGACRRGPSGPAPRALPRVLPRPGRGRPPWPSAAPGQRPRPRPVSARVPAPAPRGSHSRICARASAPGCSTHGSAGRARPISAPRSGYAPMGPGPSAAARPARVTAWERRAVRVAAGGPLRSCPARPRRPAGWRLSTAAAAQHGGRLAAGARAPGLGRRGGRPVRRWRRRLAAPRASSAAALAPRCSALLAASACRPSRPASGGPVPARTSRARASMRPAACAPPRARARAPALPSRPRPPEPARPRSRPAARTPGAGRGPAGGGRLLLLPPPPGVRPAAGPGRWGLCARS